MAYPRIKRLGHAVHLVQRLVAHTRTHQNAAHRRMRTGDIRVGAVIQVEQRGLSALEQNVAPRLDRLAQHLSGVTDKRNQRFTDGLHVLERPYRVGPTHFTRRVGLGFDEAAQRLEQHTLKLEVSGTNAHPPRPVGVSRTDAAPGGAHKVFLAVHRFVMRQNQVSAVRDV